MNGDIACFTGWHAPLALLAIAVLVIAVLLIPFVGVVSMKIHFFKVAYNLLVDVYNYCNAISRVIF